MITTPLQIILEQVSLNACPSQKTIMYDGWVIRLSDGITKRANSVNPLFPSTQSPSTQSPSAQSPSTKLKPTSFESSHSQKSVQPIILQQKNLNQKIKFCEQLYQTHNLPTVYKLTEACYPNNLDDILDKQGYVYNGLTSVQTLNLTDVESSLLTGYVSTDNDCNIIINPSFDELWLDNYLEFNSYSDDKKQGFFNILNTIALPTAFITIEKNGKQISCGLGVIEDGCIGLFDLAVDKEYRGLGYGRQLVYSLLEFGKNKGCHTAYLQVIMENTIAISLYHSVGFIEQYQYWYRIKPNKIT